MSPMLRTMLPGLRAATGHLPVSVTIAHELDADAVRVHPATTTVGELLDGIVESGGLVLTIPGHDGAQFRLRIDVGDPPEVPRG